MNSQKAKAYYDTLGLQRGCDSQSIKKAYKKAALTHHPDKGGSEQNFHLIQEAYDVLSDTTKRADYDRLLRAKNSKDGVGPKRQSSMPPKPPQSKQSSDYNRQSSDASSSAKQPTFVQIPNNLSMLTIKELKEILNKLGVRSDDCFQKSDLINRITQTMQKKKQQKKSSRQSEYQRYSTTSGPPPSAPGPPPSSKQIAIKIISIGNQEVGKSCLIKRYCEGRFITKYISTIGIDYGVKRLNIKGFSVAVNFFDLSGSQEFKLIRSQFYADTQGCLMVFDVDNRDSFSSLSSWEQEMKQYGIDYSRLKIVLCGNRADSKSREVSVQQAKKFANKKGFEYFQTSSKTGENVAQAFEWLFHAVVNRVMDDRKKLGLPNNI